MNNIDKKDIDIRTERDILEYILKYGRGYRGVVNYTIKPQIGDEVIVEDAVQGITGTIRGTIIAEVELYDCYQIKLSEFNAIYVPKDRVRVIKRKSDIEREEKIKKLEEDIHITKSEKDSVEDNLNSLEYKLDNLYKELEKLKEN